MLPRPPATRWWQGGDRALQLSSAASCSGGYLWLAWHCAPFAAMMCCPCEGWHFAQQWSFAVAILSTRAGSRKRWWNTRHHLCPQLCLCLGLVNLSRLAGWHCLGEHFMLRPVTKTHPSAIRRALRVRRIDSRHWEFGVRTVCSCAWGEAQREARPFFGLLRNLVARLLLCCGAV